MSVGARENGARILVVDDSLTYREALRERLEADGFEVRTAASGEEALERVASEGVDAVLLDVILPDLRGDEVCCRIKRDPRFAALPVILVTAQEDQETLLRCFDAGGDDFIAKSSEFEVVRARLSAQLRRKRAEDESQRIGRELAAKSAQAAQAEEMRELYERARRALEARDEFLTIASHELKTPLTTLNLQVQGLIRSIQRQRDSIPIAELEPKLRVEEAQIRRLTRIVEDLLDVTRIRNQRFSFEPVWSDLVVHVRAALERLGAEASRKHCEIRFEGPDEVLGLWDPPRIQQLVTNLVSNALKYGPSKPVEVVVRELGGARVELAVRDFGIGISAENQARIFKRFERAVSATHFGGLGLGLFICAEIAAAHGGEIHVSSEPGRGATFTVTLSKHADKAPDGVLKKAV